jgi:hypothetical protein
MAWTSALGDPCFRKIPEAPRRRAVADSVAVIPAVTIKILAVEPARRLAAMKALPLSCPRSKSKRTMST